MQSDVVISKNIYLNQNQIEIPKRFTEYFHIFEFEFILITAL